MTRNALTKLASFSILLLASGAAVQAQENYVDWLTATGPAATFEFGPTITGSVAIANPANGSGAMSSISALDGTTNYPSTWFSPAAPPVGTEWVGGGVGNVDGVNPGSVDYVITFSAPVIDPRFHFVNLDAGTVDFSPTTDSGGSPVVTSLASGNPEFEATGDLYNSTPRIALAFGCEDLVGGNPEGGCGTVQLTGSYLSVTFTCTDTDVSLVGGDGFSWTMSAATPVPVELQSFTID